ncbi:polysaccharide pyruvyl transferase family protein [Mycolicibacterium pyrenivorans]|uniref:polysaccharide pyruvyl transferase family protein n=1 Tax=Mycolicibacterium pyrenivorans TaxID=187102 RepID=UPI0021F3B7FC|nr:polysaccharide pyruvyl transferase family protein [Mycolicibacterium pyrenivorans]MCV7152492.1 polysaccharide pyruvyl transferase family protein [Mycolicibacterium pyrenivorans]
MIIDIRGTNTRNKGAHLMLQAICARLDEHFELSIPPPITDYAVRSRLGLRQTLYHPAVPRVSQSVGNLAPAIIRTAYGLTADREIGGVLDASGFHYTDQFDAALPRREALVGRAWARRGVPKVLLPQAFGPFERADTRRWSQEVLAQASLVYVRDGVSETYLRGLHTATPVVRSPDFTIGMKPADIDPVEEQFLALVPNTKLFTHGGLGRLQYVEHLAAFSVAARAHGMTSVVVVHEESDADVADELARCIDAPLFTSADPLVLKAVLGQASAAVASRFHAVVGCLSQCVPTLAFGWSHKYRELLDDFCVPDRLITPETDPGAALSQMLADTAGHTRQKDRLPELVANVDSMWGRTIEVLSSR